MSPKFSSLPCRTADVASRCLSRGRDPTFVAGTPLTGHKIFANRKGTRPYGFDWNARSVTSTSPYYHRSQGRLGEMDFRSFTVFQTNNVALAVDMQGIQT